MTRGDLVFPKDVADRFVALLTDTVEARGFEARLSRFDQTVAFELSEPSKSVVAVVKRGSPFRVLVDDHSVERDLTLRNDSGRRRLAIPRASEPFRGTGQRDVGV